MIWPEKVHQNSQTLTHAGVRPTGRSIAKTYGDPMGYWRLAQAQTMAPMSNVSAGWYYTNPQIE
jgi:hypothetical protein